MRARRVKPFFLAAAFSFLALFFSTGPGQAQIPSWINYQGYLTDSGGVPVHGTVSMTFRIYDAASGGTTALWTEIQNVAVNQGVYSVRLGENTPLNLPFDVPYSLGVAVGTGAEMTPRKELASIGYAFRAKTVESVGSHPHSGADITAGTISEARIDPLIARDSEVADAVGAHASRIDNPHQTTASQVGASPLGHTHGAADIASGALDNARFSAYADLSAEGYLDNNAGTDLLTQAQGDARYVNEGQAGSIASGMIVSPLSLSGSAASSGIISGTNSNQSGYGVYGYAGATGAVTNYGGYFTAAGDSGRGVSGTAFGIYGYGVHGTANGTYGRGIDGSSSGSEGRGVWGYASGSDGYGVYGWGQGSDGHGVHGYASGTYGRGVYGSASATGAGTNYGGFFTSAGNSGRGVYGSATATGAVTNYGGHFLAAGDSGRGVYAIADGTYGYGVIGSSDGTYGYGVVGLANHSNGAGVLGSGMLYSFYAIGQGTGYGPFTGGHEVKLAEDFPETSKPGLIVSVTGKTQVRKRSDGTATISSTLPTVRLSKAARDKAVFGVLVKEAPLPNIHWYEGREDGRFATVNALGEGRVWVTNLNGHIEAGDYITTSDIPGYGQRQDDDILRNYTLGKAIETVDWDRVTETVEHEGRRYKVFLIGVVYTSG